MYTKKIVLLLSLLYYSNPCNAMEQQTSSWFSPSYYTNLIYQTYQTSIDKLKNTWQQGMPKKAAIFKWSTAKNWPKKYEKHAEDTAQESADLFKKAIESAADRANQNGIMARFKNHPDKFLFGASSSSYQFEGGLDTFVNPAGKYDTYVNASARFYEKNNLPIAGDAIKFWNRYKQDIPRMKKELGINCFRLSIAWDRIEPEEGTYNQDAINTYVDIIKTLKNNGIEPIVVLHHYTVPSWFEDKGGFLRNRKEFVSFAKKMYKNLCEHVTYWSTFNAIEGYAFKGYFRGDGAPGNPNYKNNMEIVSQVMLSMLEAHVDIYHAIKGTTDLDAEVKHLPGLYEEKIKNNPNIPEPQIGIQKNIVLLDPSYANLYHFCLSPLTNVCIRFGNVIQNEGFYKFLTKGSYQVWIPGKVSASYYYKYANGALDWIGLNIYSNMQMFLGTPQPETTPERQTANLTYRDYPEGIYRATQEIYKRIAKPLNIPIIITENGIATDDNTKRTRFSQRALYTIRKLIEEGYPIIGYTPWASHDNYEWPTQEQPDAFTSRRYGFFEVNFDKTSPNYLKRTLKPGAYYYRDFIRNYFQSTPHYKPIKPEKE